MKKFYYSLKGRFFYAYLRFLPFKAYEISIYEKYNKETTEIVANKLGFVPELTHKTLLDFFYNRVYLRTRGNLDFYR